MPGTSVLPQVAAANTDILVWLDVLLKGKPEQQALARTEIAMILEARGHTDDAEEAYWTNVQARATDRRAYERLIAIYEQKGDRLSASLVRRQLDEVFTPPAKAASGSAGPAAVEAGPAAAGPGPARAAAPRARRLRSGEPGEAARPDQAPAVPLAAPEPPPPPTPPVVTATGPGAAAGHAYAAIIHAANLQAASARAAARQPSTGQRPSAGSASSAAAAPAQPAPMQPGPAQPLPTLPQPVQPTYDAAVPARRRLAPLSVQPEVVQPRRRFNTSGLIALQPSTIGAFLLASVGAAAIIAFVLILSERGFGSGANAAGPGAQPAPTSAASQLPPRCADVALRFPALNLSDPRGTVAAGYRANGVDVDLPRPGGARLTADQAEQVLGGWMAISLLMERSGQPAPTLPGWLDADDSRPTLANALAAGRRLDAMITPDEWATMRGWPATTCEGAFLHDPRNATAVNLMERVVAR